MRARNHRSHFTEVALQIIALGALPSCRGGTTALTIAAAASLEEAPGAQFSEPLIFHLRLQPSYKHNLPPRMMMMVMVIYIRRIDESD